MKASFILGTIAYAGGAFAHGYVQEMLIDNQRYGGYLPFSDPYQNPKPQRIGWTMPNNGPIEDVTSRAIVCNLDSTPGALVAPASAGSKITFFWTEWPDSHRGPTMTYLASCPSGDCRKEDPTMLNWFKIDHAGLNSDGTWISDTIIKNNSTWTVTIPAELKAGAYLLRHELLALHASHEVNGAQFYPMCANLEISGNGDGVPSETVKFPGAYKSDDPGIFLNIYWPVPTSYVIPGPPIVTLRSSGAEEHEEEEEVPAPVETSSTSTPTFTTAPVQEGGTSEEAVPSSEVAAPCSVSNYYTDTTTLTTYTTLTLTRPSPKPSITTFTRTGKVVIVTAPTVIVTVTTEVTVFPPLSTDVETPSSTSSEPEFIKITPLPDSQEGDDAPSTTIDAATSVVTVTQVVTSMTTETVTVTQEAPPCTATGKGRGRNGNRRFSANFWRNGAKGKRGVVWRG